MLRIKGDLPAAEPLEVSGVLGEITAQPTAPGLGVGFRISGRVHEHFYAFRAQDANVLRNRAAIDWEQRYD